jgi:hypothetical protein
VLTAQSIFVFKVPVLAENEGPFIVSQELHGSTIVILNGAFIEMKLTKHATKSQ